MASKRLAMTLHQGLRSQRALRSLKPQGHNLTRSLATPVSHGSTTESTTLSNGFTVGPLSLSMDWSTRRKHVRWSSG